MQKIDQKSSNPGRYAIIKAEQDRLREKCSILMTISMNCPYCGHQVLRLYKGDHSYLNAKCSKCGEEICFPPVSFRING